METNNVPITDKNKIKNILKINQKFWIGLVPYILSARVCSIIFQNFLRRACICAGVEIPDNMTHPHM